MKKISLVFFALALTGASLQFAASAQGTATAPKPTSRVIEDGGTGMYPAIMLSEASLPTHTIFRPQDLKMFDKKNKMPILVWGNGACGNSPWEHLNFLSEVASHGFFIVAIGPMPQEGERGRGQTQATMLTDAMNWAIAQNADKNSPYFEKLDVAKIAAAGMSCGGLQALEVAGDSRLSTVIVCNSGIFITGTSSAMSGMPALTKDQLKKVHTPIMYMLGGSEDIAYANGMDDYKQINHVPAFVANMNVGHGGTYMQPHGGEFAKLATAWLKWHLMGDKEAAKTFVGNPAGLSKNSNWVFEKKKID
jgi:dienelactone hydrolase